MAAEVELEAEPAPEPAPEPVPEPTPEATAVEMEPDRSAPEGESEGIDFDADRYTTAIEEPDWFEAEADEPATQPAEPEPASAPEPEMEPEPELVESSTPGEPEPEAEPASEPEQEPVEAAAPKEPTPPHEATAADEETMLWFGQPPAVDSGADEMEVAGGASPPQAAATGPEADLLPGSRELDEALSSLEELTRRTRQSGPGETEEWLPASAELPSSGASSWAMPARAPLLGGGRPGSPATRAYRRLRRIFPG